ncbi:TIGR02186 family protein [Brevundimonas sp. 2R-24]|uniref:TIGR02186 family protein n=1 Tax=Peiella sedimenti TaxID=3061083 RepID=A0ABT8SHG9_9CAUL|nr:TIGR02186 family protein [Caulobacteraceae bacterium XZ-24]
MIQLPPPPPAIEAPAPIPEAPLSEAVAAAEARPTPTIAADLTQTEVEVDSTYAGARMVLYGAVFNPTGRPTDVVVVVTGPPQPIRLVRKHRVAGLWLNSRPVVFEGAPGFYMAASTRPLGDITGFTTRRRLTLGVDHLRIEAPAERRVVTQYGVRDVVVSRLGDEYLDWRRAVIGLKTEAGLYAEDPGGVRFVDRGLFRAEVTLPSSAPTGRYEAQVWLFQDGEPVSVRTRSLVVRKVGVERALYTFAHQRPWTYGVLAVLIAMLTGLLASRFFRRN